MVSTQVETKTICITHLISDTMMMMMMMILKRVIFMKPQYIIHYIIVLILKQANILVQPT